MRPLVFGYMRVPQDMAYGDVEHRHRTMETYAEAQGLALGAVFHELIPGSRSAFGELIASLLRGGAGHVVVASAGEFALTVPLQDVMLLHVEQVARAEVHVLDEL